MNSATHKLSVDTTVELVRRATHEALLNRLEARDAAMLNDEASLRACVKELIKDTLESKDVTLDSSGRDCVATRLVADIIGMGPMAPLMLDGDITDILINGHDEIWIDKHGQLSLTTLRFDDETQLRRFLERIVESCGRTISFRSPMVDARLPDGSRLHAVIPPLSQSGIVISIRRFKIKSPSRRQLVDSGFISPEILDFLEIAVREGRNIVISGGAGTGKTTLLNVLSRFIPDSQRVVTIEDSAELNLEHGHVIRLEAKGPNADDIGKINIRDLLKTALRMRADRLVVGEVRGSEVLEMLQAFSVGHDGGMTTVHANSAGDTIRRLESLALMHSPSLTRVATRQMIGSAVDLVVHLYKPRDGERRVDTVSAVSVDGEDVTLEQLFAADGRPTAALSNGATLAGQVQQQDLHGQPRAMVIRAC